MLEKIISIFDTFCRWQNLFHSYNGEEKTALVIFFALKIE